MQEACTAPPGEGGVHSQPMLRLVAYAPDGVRRFPIHRSELIIGSWPECDIFLPYAGVAQKHARITYDGTALRIEDLGTRKGLLVSGRKVRDATLEVLDEIRLGGVTLLVEDVTPGPEKAISPPPVEEKRVDGPPVLALSALGHLLVLGLVHHVGWYEPILPGHPGQQDLTLDPNLVVGESAAMKQVVEMLRSAIDPPVHVLLSGDPGVGKDLLAKSLHLSGPRRQGPFITATCGGAKPQQIEADLFGAEIPGKGGPVRREGKLVLASGGTLFLDEIEQLPMDLQARLVRYLRSGQVEPTGSNEAHSVDVRLVVGSRAPLDSVVAQDRFRVDLAYRLSQFMIEVPPLRDRREDLPLLIQSYINKFCHELGKRIQGITVKAMSALLSYDYPGNLAELETIARQLVYMAPVGRPVDVNLLPERVRNGPLAATSRVDTASDLQLERLVSGTEQVAIREALRRTNGNKSQAARLLGLSRNGLAIKMERYGIKT